MAKKSMKEIESMAKTLETSAKSIAIAQPNVMSIAVEVVGTSALIMNNFSQKSVEQMLAKHMGITVQREVKKPRDVLEQATIRNTDGKECLPPTAFKLGMLTASTTIKTLKKTQLRTLLFIEGSSIPITYSKRIPRMDMVRVGMRQPDVRFRPSFLDWKARLCIQYADLLNAQSVIDLLNRAGSVGVGEWRPEKNGTFGTYRVERLIGDKKEIAEVRDLCSVPLVPLVIPEWALDLDIDPLVLAKAFGDAAAAEMLEESDKQEAGAAE